MYSLRYIEFSRAECLHTSATSHKIAKEFRISFPCSVSDAVEGERKKIARRPKPKEKKTVFEARDSSRHTKNSDNGISFFFIFISKPI
jgi:hypothetical protein